VSGLFKEKGVMKKVSDLFEKGVRFIFPEKGVNRKRCQIYFP
jgi:hypothetical protein